MPRDFNSLAPGRSEQSFQWLIFKRMSFITGWGISSEIALRWMSLDFTGDKSTLVQVMAWCHRTTNHYLSQCWPRSVSPFVVTGPQWVKGSCQPFWMMSSNLKQLHIDGCRSFHENMNNFVVSTVPADGLAPDGARPSACTVVSKSKSCTFTELEFLKTDLQHFCFTTSCNQNGIKSTCLLNCQDEYTSATNLFFEVSFIFINSAVIPIKNLYEGT